MQVDQETYKGNVTPVPVLPLARYRLRFKPSGEGRLPAYAGSAWRGALGHALKKAVCVTRLSSCPPCLLYRSLPFLLLPVHLRDPTAPRRAENAQVHGGAASFSS